MGYFGHISELKHTIRFGICHILDAEMKLLHAHGLGITPKQAQRITSANNEELCASLDHVLGDHSSQVLCNEESSCKYVIVLL